MCLRFGKLDIKRHSPSSLYISNYSPYSVVQYLGTRQALQYVIFWAIEWNLP